MHTSVFLYSQMSLLFSSFYRESVLYKTVCNDLDFFVYENSYLIDEIRTQNHTAFADKHNNIKPQTYMHIQRNYKNLKPFRILQC